MANFRLNQKDLARAIQLAQGIVARVERQPVPLSTSETQLLACAVLELTRGDDSHDMADERATQHAASPAIPFTGELEHLNHLSAVLDSDEIGILHAEESYRASWKRRGGVGAFMMLARKWDRLEPRTMQQGWDIFAAIHMDKRREGAIDDVRDLRRYLTLVECEAIRRGYITPERNTKDTTDAVR